jgi:hypothetical protein
MHQIAKGTFELFLDQDGMVRTINANGGGGYPNQV